MLSILEFLAAPFASCMILVAILGYFGLHVLRRGVIFVDLALAQIAALGTVLAFFAGHDPGTTGSFMWSLGATIVGAFIFSVSRTRRSRVPQEAIIGISYVVAAAAVILVADRAPEGAEHIKELLSGAILWVTWPTVIRDATVVAAVGVFHWIFRKHFILITEEPEKAQAKGMGLRRWDFLFYLVFGVVITLAVNVAGVLMVFTYLVAPAIIALSLADHWGARLGIAWAVGTLGSVLGLAISYKWDAPSGPAIVCSLGGLLILFAFKALVPRRVSERETDDAQELVSEVEG